MLKRKLFEQECIPVGCVLSAAVAVSASGPGGVSLWSRREVSASGPEGRGVHTPLDRHPPWADTPPAQCMLGYTPHCGQNGRRSWKHYLYTTTVADGKNGTCVFCTMQIRPDLLVLLEISVLSVTVTVAYLLYPRWDLKRPKWTTPRAVILIEGL